MADNIEMTANGPDPQTLDVSAGTKITWENDLSVSVRLTLPTCVSPPDGTIAVAAGATTREFTVNNGSNGSYGYSYSDTATTQQDGTIDVS